MSEQKKSPVSSLAIFTLAGCLALSGYLLSNKVSIQKNEAIAEQVEEVKKSALETPVVKSALDVDEALTIRAIGNPDAPVRIDEYASLTCGHCAHFHNETYKELKKEFIDTGKVYFVFNAFPLNAPAMMASKISRCLPEARYEKFVSLLFATQENWAFSSDYKLKLEQNARLAGLNKEAFDACAKNTKIERALSAKMKSASEQHNVRSTPTFVLNNGTKVLAGGNDINAFRSAIEELTKEATTTE